MFCFVDFDAVLNTTHQLLLISIAYISIITSIADMDSSISYNDGEHIESVRPSPSSGILLC